MNTQTSRGGFGKDDESPPGKLTHGQMMALVLTPHVY